MTKEELMRRAIALAVPAEQRQKQMLALLPTEALAAFEAWKKKDDKIAY